VDRSIDDPAPFVTTNVLGTQTLLTLAREHRVPRFVHISTDEVYGSLGPEGRFREDTPLAPNSPYSASKAGPICWCGLPPHLRPGHGHHRCSNNYGPYQFPEKLIPLMISRARRTSPCRCTGTGPTCATGFMLKIIAAACSCPGKGPARRGVQLRRGRGAAQPGRGARHPGAPGQAREPHHLRQGPARPRPALRHGLLPGRAGAGYAPSLDFAAGIASTIDCTWGTGHGCAPWRAASTGPSWTAGTGSGRERGPQGPGAGRQDRAARDLPGRGAGKGRPRGGGHRPAGPGRVRGRGAGRAAGPARAGRGVQHLGLHPGGQGRGRARPRRGA
jgi:hypothetical protein